MLRPIGKSARLAIFQKETKEGVFIQPTEEHAFKSCDAKKTMKTEEDASLVGSVYTTDLVTMGYEVNGNVEMNAYPDKLGDILYYSMGKSELGELAEAIFTIRYHGDKPYARVSKTGGEVILQTSNDGVVWVDDLNIDDLNVTLEQFKTLAAPINWICQILGVQNKTLLALHALLTVDGEVIRSNYENITLIKLLRKNSTFGKTHTIYPSNVVTDTIPAFSMILDKGYGANKAFGYSGCKVNTASFTFATKTFFTVTLSVRAKQELPDQTYTAQPVKIQTPYTTNNASILIDGVLFEDIKELKIDINNNMYIDEAVGLETYNAQNRQGGNINISGTANLTIDDTLNATYILNKKYEKNEALDLAVIVKSDALIDNVQYLTMFYIPKVKLSDGTVSVGGAERLSLSFAGQAVKNTLSNVHIITYTTNNKLTNY